MMKSLIPLSIFVMLSASQADALSCISPDVARTFNQVSAADETYVVLLGSFEFEPPKTPRRNINNPAEVRVTSVFRGQFLGAEGFGDAAPQDVTLHFSCMGPWCGSLPDSGETILGFVERTSQGFVFDIDPCYSKAFVSPSPVDIARVEACMRGEDCEQEPMR